MFFFFFKQKTAYEMRISDWSSDVCSSDLFARLVDARERLQRYAAAVILQGAAQILPVAAHGERRGADRAAEIEGEDLAMLIAPELQCHQREKHRLSGAGRADDEAVADVEIGRAHV